jgi:hypothetical protein
MLNIAACADYDAAQTVRRHHKCKDHIIGDWGAASDGSDPF